MSSQLTDQLLSSNGGVEMVSSIPTDQNLLNQQQNHSSREDHFFVDISRELVPVVERDGDNSWNLPVDHRESFGSIFYKRFFSWLEMLCIMGLLVYTVYSFFSENVFKTWRQLAVYMILGLFAECGITLVAAAALLLTRIIGGSDAIPQVQPASGIFVHVFHAISCYCLCGYGCYLLIKFNKRLVERPLLLYYVIFETAVTLIYSLLTCPIVGGALGYISHKIHRKLHRQPVVVFHSTERPNWFVSYFGLRRLGSAMGRMGPPSPGDQDYPHQEALLRRHQQQERRRDIENFDEVQFEMGEVVGSLSEDSPEVLMERMGL